MNLQVVPHLVSNAFRPYTPLVLVYTYSNLLERAQGIEMVAVRALESPCMTRHRGTGEDVSHTVYHPNTSPEMFGHDVLQ